MGERNLQQDRQVMQRGVRRVRDTSVAAIRLSFEL
jgi:hypothetical protein